MINDDLLNKFNSIPDLPVSEEILGVYIEGRLNPLENMQVSSILEMESELSALDDSELDNSYDDFIFNEPETPSVDLDTIELPDIEFQSTSELRFENFSPELFNSEAHAPLDSINPLDDLGSETALTNFNDDFLSVDDRFPHIDESLDIDPEQGEDNIDMDSLM